MQIASKAELPTFMKTELELINICVLNAGYAKTSQEWKGTGLSSPFVRLYYIKAGHATIVMPDAQLEARPGFMYIVPSFVPHSITCEAGFEFYYLFVYERYGQQTDLFDIYSFPHEVEANHAIDLLFENYCNYYPQLNLPYRTAEEFYAHPSYQEYVVRYANMDRYEKMQLQGFVWIVGSFFMKHAHKRIDDIDDRVLRVITYIKDNMQHEMTTESMADVACVTKAHLGRLFRQTLGCSPIQFVLRTRIQCAQRLLVTTSRSVGAIADEVGFNDVSYFVRLFRQKIGFTPQEYRERLR